MATAKKPVRKVISKEAISEDLELHVVRTWVDPEHIFIEIRNYIPSLKEYGRGITFPATAGKRVVKAVEMCSP